MITICGSTKYKDAFIEWNKKLTLTGCLVFTVGSFLHSGDDDVTVEQKAALDVLHYAKIDRSDSILVLNVNDYIGESTRREIAYAEWHDKTIRYLSERSDWWNGD